MTDISFSRQKLLQSRSTVVPVELAVTLHKETGLKNRASDAAIFVQQIHYWIQKGAGKVVDGVRWIFNTYDQWRSQLPWLTEWDFRVVTHTLRDLDLIRFKMLSDHGRDRTGHYTINYNHPWLKVYKKYHNAWQSAPIIWDTLAQKYLGWVEGQWLGNAKPIWDLACDSQLQNCEKVLLTTTFDKVMVKRGDIPKVIEAINSWDKINRFAANYDLMVSDLEQLSKDAQCFAVCWNQTSVSDTWTSSKEIIDEDGYKYNPFWNISVDEGHWFLEWQD